MEKLDIKVRRDWQLMEQDVRERFTVELKSKIGLKN